MVTETSTTVPCPDGELNAVIRDPESSHPVPGIVLVDGSGDGTCESWGELPAWVSDCGTVVLRHDKPGCGGSPGDWTTQTFEDRARESLAALHQLRQHPSIAGRKVGLYGVSQGGWIALLAAAMEPETVAFIVTHSGPGVSPAEQERHRLLNSFMALELEPSELHAAMSWVDERYERLMRGDDVVSVVQQQEEYRDRKWYPALIEGNHDKPEVLEFGRKIMQFNPRDVMAQVKCPVLALFGGADPLVPVADSVSAFASQLPPRPYGHGIAVFPGGDHGLFVAAPDPATPRREQLASAYLPTLQSFLANHRQVGVED